MSGVAVQVSVESRLFLVFVDGEGEGAVYSDSHGELYGDRAVYEIDKDGRFLLYIIDRNTAEKIASGCRIYEKSHLTDDRTTFGLAETTGSGGPARLTFRITHHGLPVSGARVELRGQGGAGIFGVTSPDGDISLTPGKGEYEYSVRGQDLHVYMSRIFFKGIDTRIDLDI